MFSETRVKRISTRPMIRESPVCFKVEWEGQEIIGLCSDLSLFWSQRQVQL